MNKKKDEASDKWAYLLKPAKDLTDNFSIDLLTYLNEYLEKIRNKEDDDDQSFDAHSNYKLFNFARACIVLQGSTTVYAKKVDFIYDEVYGLLNMMENSKRDGGEVAGKKGRRRKVDATPSSFELIDLEAVENDILKQMPKIEKEEKSAVDNLRLVDNADEAESQYERKHVRLVKPTQFMFGKNCDQFMRTDEQVFNSKNRAEVIGKVRDFDLKKSNIIQEHQLVVTHDTYAKNVKDFTLPGARWIPDNKELAAHFGVADIEIELNMEIRNDRISAHGPFRDPLSGRDIVAPPKWYIEQEAVKQNNEIQSRISSSAGIHKATGGTLQDSQGFSNIGSQQIRLSQPMMEKQRNLTQFVSFVEGRLNKTRPSTHLNTGLVDMLVSNFGGAAGGGGGGGGREGINNISYQNNMDIDDDYGNGMDIDDGGEEEDDDYVEGLRRNREKRIIAPWDDIDNDPMASSIYNGDEQIRLTNKDIKINEKDPMTSLQMFEKKKKKEEKEVRTRKDDFMKTHDYLQHYYYWRTSARINPTNDWKVEALRTIILKENKKRAKERIQKIKEARAKREEVAEKTIKRRGGRLTVEEFDMAITDGNQNDQINRREEQEEAVEREGENGRNEKTQRRTIGVEYDDVADEDLAAEVELSMLGGAYDNDDDDVLPRVELPPPQNVINETIGGEREGERPQIINNPINEFGLKFDAIDDAELANIVNLPGELFINRALPLLKKFAESRSDREQMAYEMAKAYENVDIATSTLQAQVDEWQEKLEPVLEEGETRKEYEVHAYGSHVLDQFENDGQTKSFEELCIGKPWYEISRYFLSCLLMSNTKNVKVTEDKTLDLSERINTMKVSLISKERHHEVFEQDGAI